MKEVFEDLVMLVFRKGALFGFGIACVIASFFATTLLTDIALFFLGCFLIYIAFKDSNDDN